MVMGVRRSIVAAGVVAVACLPGGCGRSATPETPASAAEPSLPDDPYDLDSGARIALWTAPGSPGSGTTGVSLSGPPRVTRAVPGPGSVPVFFQNGSGHDSLKSSEPWNSRPSPYDVPARQIREADEAAEEMLKW
jgi:hypothetical protein